MILNHSKTIRSVISMHSRDIETKSTLFTISTDEWDTKEDIGKSMKNALYVLRYTKRHLRRRTVKKSSL